MFHSSLTPTTQLEKKEIKLPTEGSQKKISFEQLVLYLDNSDIRTNLRPLGPVLGSHSPLAMGLIKVSTKLYLK